MVRELNIFLKRNKVQLIIAIICIFITIKQMNAPFIFSYNTVTSFLFERVATEKTWGELLNLLSDLGFAYYSSLIFYYVVDYFPTRRRENEALKIVADHLSKITIYIRSLFSVLLFVSDNGSRVEDLKGNYIFRELCDIELNNDILRCNWKVINSVTNDIYMEGKGDALYPFDSVKMISEKILEEINNINSHTNAEKLEEEIKEILCALSENKYLNKASSLEGGYLGANLKSIVINCNVSDLLELLGICLTIEELPINQYDCAIWKSTEQDLLEIERIYKNLKEEMPQAIEAYEKTMKRIRKR